MKRTQIYLDDEQDRLLAQRAAATGKTKSDLIRGAIDQYLDTPADDEARLAEFKAAAAAAFGIAPYFTHEYLDELREPDRQRTDELAAAGRVRPAARRKQASSQPVPAKGTVSDLVADQRR